MTKTNASILAYLSIMPVVAPEDLSAIEGELSAAGVSLPTGDLRAALHREAVRHPITGMWTLPNSVRPTFGFDELQDDLRRVTGLTGPALWAAWRVVKGHLRIRWAAGNYRRPAPHVMGRWVASAV